MLTHKLCYTFAFWLKETHGYKYAKEKRQLILQTIADAISCDITLIRSISKTTTLPGDSPNRRTTSVMGKGNCSQIEVRKLTQIRDDAEFNLNMYSLWRMMHTDSHVTTTPDVTIHCLPARAASSHREDAAVSCSAQEAAVFSCEDILGEVQFLSIF